MATIQLSTADASGFVPMFWAQRALDVLRANIVLAKIAARDSDFTEVAFQGKTITIPYPGTFAIQDKAAGTPITPVAPTGGSSIALTLSKHKVAAFSVEDFAAAQANQSLMDRYVEPATINLVEQFETDLWSTAMQGGAIAPQGTAGTSVSSATLRTSLQRFGEAKAPMNDRHIVLSPKDQAAILGDTNLQNYFAFSQPGVVSEGMFGRAYGLNVHMSQLAPSGYTVSLGAATAGTFTLTIGGQTTSAIAYNATAATVQTAVQGLSSVGAGLASVSGVGGLSGAYSIVLTGTAAGQAITGAAVGLTGGTFAIAAAQKNYATHRNGIVFASRQFEPIPAGTGVQSATATDPDSGLALRISAQYDVNAIAMRMNLDMLYGTAVLRPSQSFVVDA